MHRLGVARTRSEFLSVGSEVSPINQSITNTCGLAGLHPLENAIDCIVARSAAIPPRLARLQDRMGLAIASWEGLGVHKHMDGVCVA